MPPALPVEIRSKAARLMAEGNTVRAVAAKMAVSESYLQKMRERASKIAAGNVTHGLYQIANGVDRKPPIDDPRLDRSIPVPARQALDDIRLFALRYFGLRLKPWQVEAAQVVVKLLDSPDKEFLVVNLPPGAGKSTFFVLILPCWLTVKDRTIRGLITSATQDTARWYLRRIKQALTTVEPFQAKPRERELGLAFNAKACLAVDYGTFRPDDRANLTWTQDAISVVPPPGHPPSEKENTWQAFGRSGSFLGARVDIALGDDVYDPVQLRTSEAREELYRWWDEQVETRLEPAGLLVAQGQRLGPDDLYRHCLNKPDDTLDDDAEDYVEPQTPDRNEQARIGADGLPVKAGKYRHIVYRAHYETLCTGRHPKDADPYPEGCLLDPNRLRWRDLMAVRTENPARYATVYQQDDTPVGSILVHPLWVSGGRDPETGETFPGCWDDQRDEWQIPQLQGPSFFAATVDPSPTKWWSIQAWLYNSDSLLRYLIAHQRTRMSGPDLLDWDAATGTWTGIMETWQNRSVQQGRRITHWIVEQNAAQRWLLQYQHVHRWKAKHSVTIVGHDTHSKNKSDTQLGVSMIAPHWHYGRVRLPGKPGTLGRQQAQHLVNEVTRWPEGRTEDCVMAEWFYEHNLPQLFRPEQGNVVHLRRPSWVSSIPDMRKAGAR